jgi:hypothetical protein
VPVTLTAERREKTLPRRASPPLLEAATGSRGKNTTREGEVVQAEARAEAKDALGGGSGGAAPAASRGAVSAGTGLLIGAACLLPRHILGGCRAVRQRQPGGRQVSDFASRVASVLIVGCHTGTFRIDQACVRRALGNLIF